MMKKKILNKVFLSSLVVLLGVLISGYFLFVEYQNSALIKKEIDRFIESDLNNCWVLSTMEVKFSGMGYYMKVKTSCKDEWFPVLFEFEQMRELDKEMFKSRPIISKEEGSKKVFVDDGIQELWLDIREPSSLDDFSFIHFIGLAVLITVLLIFFEEKMRDKDGKSIFLK